jgi:hypothetical protein
MYMLIFGYGLKKRRLESVCSNKFKKKVREIRTNNDRNVKTSFCIVDAQSVKNTDTAEKKGYDAGKKISGIKRHIAVDTEGLPHAIYITTANVGDREGAERMISQEKEYLSNVKNLLVDGGYTGEPFAQSPSTIFWGQQFRLQNAVSYTHLP